MHCHCGTNNRAPRWTFTYLCTPEVRPGARKESASPAWLAAPAMNARDTTKVYLYMEAWHWTWTDTATAQHEKGIITLESNPSRGTVLPAPYGKGNKIETLDVDRHYLGSVTTTTHQEIPIGCDGGFNFYFVRIMKGLSHFEDILLTVFH